MARPLVIVESPAKAKTIGKFLGSGYMVEASIGHVRDLPKSAADIPAEVRGQAWARLGVDVANGFAPLYVVSPEKKEQVSRLRTLLKEASKVYLATDEDREGESISWHLLEVLKPKASVPVHRLVFHEITQTAIQKALASPRTVDMNLVRAQETRRVVDRLFGYEVSPLLWKKIAPKLSAGRVQSVAVRLLVERERARMAFVPAAWFDLEGKFDVPTGRLSAMLTEVDGRRIATGRDFDEATGKLAKKDVLLIDEPTAKQLAARAKGRTGSISRVDQKPYREKPSPPFTTSTLQQEANRKLKWAAKRAMQVAQKLYENGWITYMRTDSVVLSDQAIEAARTLILNSYGPDFLPKGPRHYKSTAKNAQEAHEAIRPAGESFRSIEEARRELDADEARLYELIWKRTVACQMEDATGSHITVGVDLPLPAAGEHAAARLAFAATGKTIEFPGFRRAYVEGSDDPEAELADQERLLPAVKVSDPAQAREVVARSHVTQPPARLTEATLVKELESRGIGRPSTYASIIDTILQREYIFRRGNAMIPTFTGFAVVNLLEKALPSLVDYSFTARMEDALDEIALGRRERLSTLQDFYKGSSGLCTLLFDAESNVDPRAICTIPFGEHEGQEVCIRVGRFGPFASWSDKTAQLPDEVAPDEVTTEWVLDLLKKKADGPRTLGPHPDGDLIFLIDGRFGPYVQKGEAREGEKPPRASLLQGMTPENLDLQTAIKLLSLPRTLGRHPESGEEVVATNGKFGPYVRCGDQSRSIPAGIPVLDITLTQALALLAEPARRGKTGPLRELGNSPEGHPVRVLEGRFGLYVTDGRINANLPRAADPQAVTLEEALALIQKRIDAGAVPAEPKKPAAKTAKAPVKTAPEVDRSVAASPLTAPAGAEPKKRARKADPAPVDAEAPKKRARKAADPAPEAEAEAPKKRARKAAEPPAVSALPVLAEAPKRTRKAAEPPAALPALPAKAAPAAKADPAPRAAAKAEPAAKAAKAEPAAKTVAKPAAPTKAPAKAPGWDGPPEPPLADEYY